MSLVPHAPEESLGALAAARDAGPGRISACRPSSPRLLDGVTRRKILIAIGARTVTAGHVSRALRAPFSTVSTQLSTLVSAGVLECERRARFRLYSVRLGPALEAWDAYLNVGGEAG